MPLHFAKLMQCVEVNAPVRQMTSGEIWQQIVEMSPCEDMEYDTSDFKLPDDVILLPSGIVDFPLNSPVKRREITVSFSNANALEQHCPEGVRFYESSDSLSEMESRCLQVANVPSSATENDVRQLFKAYGDIEELDTNNMHRGLVLVRFYDLRAARSLRSARLQIQGNALIMSYGDAKPVSNTRRPPNNGTIVVFRLPHNITDEEFTTLIGDITKEVDGIVKATAQRGAVFGRPSATGNKGNQDGTLTKEQEAAIAHRDSKPASDGQPF